MDLAALNEALLARTAQKHGLREVVDAYSRAVADAAGVLEVPLASSAIRGDSGGSRCGWSISRRWRSAGRR